MHLVDAGVGGIKGARDRIKADLAGNLLLELAPQGPALNDFEWFARQENQLYSVAPMTIQNRWFQLCASVIAMVMIANLQYAWTLFVNPIQQGTGWKLSDIQWAFTLFILFQTWVQPAQGWLIDRVGPRVFTTIAGVLCGIGWAGLGMAHSLTTLYALYVIAGVGAALVYGGSIGSALKWFTDRRGLAAGIIAGSFGGGA